MNEPKILTASDCRFIKKTPISREYKSDAKEGFKGKKYHIYAFGDKGFAVHEDDTFNADFAKGNIYECMITVSDEGWSLANYVSNERQKAYESTQAVLTQIRATGVVASATEAQLNALG